MNRINLHLQHTRHHWRKDLQFAVGVIVAVGGAAALLAEIARWLA